MELFRFEDLAIGKYLIEIDGYIERVSIWGCIFLCL